MKMVYFHFEELE